MTLSIMNADTGGFVGPVHYPISLQSTFYFLFLVRVYLFLCLSCI